MMDTTVQQSRFTAPSFSSTMPTYLENDESASPGSSSIGDFGTLSVKSSLCGGEGSDAGMNPECVKESVDAEVSMVVSNHSQCGISPSQEGNGSVADIPAAAFPCSSAFFSTECAASAGAYSNSVNSATCQSLCGDATTCQRNGSDAVACQPICSEPSAVWDQRSAWQGAPEGAHSRMWPRQAVGCHREPLQPESPKAATRHPYPTSTTVHGAAGSHRVLPAPLSAPCYWTTGGATVASSGSGGSGSQVRRSGSERRPHRPMSAARRRPADGTAASLSSAPNAASVISSAPVDAPVLEKASSPSAKSDANSEISLASEEGSSRKRSPEDDEQSGSDGTSSPSNAPAAASSASTPTTPSAAAAAAASDGKAAAAAAAATTSEEATEEERKERRRTQNREAQRRFRQKQRGDRAAAAA
eukprot:CAMPEP_0113683690 /NCGR_PEP_ID=MMETSP0038_2-20120614/13491_1 /TAXON_ID=2898 /ORGANISM="Cryptomonas paramecium" /LENGTH=415 /DNA_ID=CAMNT_0000603163 /DNA_START=694 /DNA_END=1937 /DNA_ORIENTATION=+ /assembly_acc=CAM_ASM_000170